MAVLVTGAAGFIGMHVCRALLARGEAVTGIDSLNDYYDPALKRARLAHIGEAGGDFAFHHLDFADDDALHAALAGTEFDRVVHLGAQAGVRYSIDHPKDYVRANLVGHINMVELARERNARHFVYASSSSVYGRNTSLPFRVEDRVDHPVSTYAATKRADELLSEAISNIHRLPQTGLRFFTVYGPWGRPDMAPWLFADAILAGRPIRVFNHGDMLRDFTYIDDIVSGVVATLDRPPLDDGSVKPGGSTTPHAIYNIGNSKAERLDTLISAFEEACGKPAIRQMEPMQPGDVPATFADVSALERDTGFRPSTPISVGVPRFVAWFRAYTGR